MMETKQEDIETERGSTRLYSEENLLWKRQWACHKIDYGMNDIGVVPTPLASQATPLYWWNP
jgi:hypothetical protein